VKTWRVLIALAAIIAASPVEAGHEPPAELSGPVRVIDGDCLGTIAEIGLAYGARVPVYLFFGEALTLKQRYDFWFVAQFAAHVHERVSVNHAFARALKIERAHSPSIALVGGTA
jgi:hypothetical protein